MRRKLAFLVAVFCATVLAMAVQKPVFMAWYAAEAAGAGFGGWMEVLWHGLTLDMTVAGYVTALPLLAVLLSLWVRIPERVWRGVLTAYFALIAVVTAVIFAVDVALYEHWGFRIDATVLIYAHLIELGHKIVSGGRTRERGRKLNRVQRSARGIKSGGYVQGDFMLEKSMSEAQAKFNSGAEKLLDKIYFIRDILFREEQFHPAGVRTEHNI